MGWSSFFKSLGNMAMMGITAYEVGRQTSPNDVIVQITEAPKMIESDHHNVSNICIIVLLSVLIIAIIGMVFARACGLLRSVKQQNDIEMYNMRTRIPRPQHEV